ncbi:hypothetical protein [Gottfriedia luciferensis]|uniref:hypothetical protein n=1 Tax=Gottfriedia luciferensis TaxID=178774 RepID=UPI001155098F|nr:hypothetical protein [Gottfriedia luciferensis]
MGCNCNNERNNERNNEWNNNRNRRRDRDITFNAKVTIDKEDFCRAVDRCDDDRRDIFGRRICDRGSWW